MKLYLVYMSDPDTGESFYKIGVTKTDVPSRFSHGEPGACNTANTLLNILNQMSQILL